MKAVISFVVVLSMVCLSQARAEQSIFNDDGKPASPPSEPTPPPSPAPHRVKAGSSGTSSTPSTDDLNDRIVQLQKENADLTLKVKELTELNNILRQVIKGNELAKVGSKQDAAPVSPQDRAIAAEQQRADKRAMARQEADQEREKRKAVAKRKAENERFDKIQVGITLSEAETLAHNRAKLTSSRIIQIQPRVGYFGPLQVREADCTLHAMKDGTDSELWLVVTGGTITSISNSEPVAPPGTVRTR
ncbi:MAG TPA: hypothetical protein VFC78_02465 [Tepidisphaeraceae bacterium]|nr:hypothetical protein [Tepidisphaeraceae bacterium]